MTRILLIVLSSFFACLTSHADDVPAWVGSMRAVHARFTGKPGTFAQFGDSITVTFAYWTPLQYERKNLDDAGQRAWQLVGAHMLKDCWRWKGADFGSDGGKTVAWADQHVDAWLKKLNPEAALIMFGTNDLNQLKPEQYEAGLRSVVKKCLDNGTVVILSTIPPRHDQAEKSKQFAEIARKVAADLKIPLVDYQAEILKRRPTDWDGAEQFKNAKDVYDVPIPISADGVHPSAPKQFANDYSEEALKSSGYNLRTYLTLTAYADVIANVLRSSKP
jgi:lysophospholipase L1-like esterase